MLTLLALASAAGAAPAGCFNGGALVGAQAGFSHIEIKRLAKDKAISKDDADKVFDALASILTATFEGADNNTDEGKKTTTTDKDGNTKVYVSISKDAKADDVAAAFKKEIDGLRNSSTLKITSVTLQTDPTEAGAWTNGGANFDAAGKPTGILADGIKKATDALGKKDDFTKVRVALDAETKYTSNNGFAGIHVGYLGRVNEKFLVGGLVEGNWVFGQDMKVDSTAEKDTSARFNANLFLRAVFNLTGNFMAGADLGVSFQEIRTLKEVGKTDKESKWFWGPAARLVLGVALTDNILATAHFGGVFPIKQDHFKKDFKAKYSNFHGGVGISYAFGG
jgi:hypothetical protein